MMETAKSKQEDEFEVGLEDWPWLWAIWDAECLDWKQGLTFEEIFLKTQLPALITDNLFLGNAFSVQSIEKLKARGITAVLNMAGPKALKPTTIQAYKNNGIQYMHIDADDEFDYPLLEKHWQEAFDFIESTTKKSGKGKCVVHCLAGRNRSGLIAAAYFMMSTQTNVLESVLHVRHQRGNVALSNQGFQGQLVALARKHDLLGPTPGTAESIVKQSPPPSSSEPRHWAIASRPRDKTMEEQSS